MEKIDFKFENYARRVGTRRGLEKTYDWFEWKVFMNEEQEKLERVRSVEYRLHDTFPDPLREVFDRETQFALKSAGWGSFMIYIVVHLVDGVEINTKHFLDLDKPWPDHDQDYFYK